MARSKQTEEQRKIAGIRLDNVIKEKKVTRKYVLTYLHTHGFTAIDDRKLSDYTTGRRPIPEDVAQHIADCLNIDVGFLTDTLTFYDLAFEEETYANYVRQRSFDGLKSSDFFIRFKEMYKFLGLSLCVYNTGIYELHGKDFSIQLDAEEVAEHFHNIAAYANSYIKEISDKSGNSNDKAAPKDRLHLKIVK